MEDVLLMDSGSGNMVLEKNIGGNGTAFSPVIQDSHNQFTQIAPAGATPVAAKAVDVNGDGTLDIVVAYKNSSSLGVFINQGQARGLRPDSSIVNGGIFYTTAQIRGLLRRYLAAGSVPCRTAPPRSRIGNFTGTDARMWPSFRPIRLHHLNVAEGDGTGTSASCSSGVALERNRSRSWRRKSRAAPSRPLCRLQIGRYRAAAGGRAGYGTPFIRGQQRRSTSPAGLPTWM